MKKGMENRLIKEIKKYLQNECRTYKSEVRTDVLINKGFYNEEIPNLESKYEKIFDDVVDSISP
ncbi:MAG: hypothetical protein H8D80_00420 [Proteobacteria bacterium]|nr:hypothetical protein [Pseudomonadota bacterium]